VLNKFISGLVLGLGFSVSFTVVVSLWFFLIMPNLISSQPMAIKSTSTTLPVDNEYPYIENFHKLPVEDKIANSTAIIVTKISKNEGGIYQTIVSEILKKQDDIELYYKQGDIFEDHSDYNDYEKNNRHIPEGFIVFMRGTPAQMKYSTSYSGGERISSLGDIPMALFREKCDKPKANEIRLD